MSERMKEILTYYAVMMAFSILISLWSKEWSWSFTLVYSGMIIGRFLR
jgi:uncharacterized membrane protein